MQEKRSVIIPERAPADRAPNEKGPRALVGAGGLRLAGAGGDVQPIMPAPTVLLVLSSMMMKAPVARLSV